MNRSRGGSGLISAALIVRDEELYLGGCLASIASIVDEIVVVDTGSQDRSREIARAHGAHVFEHEWANDFAAARNAALDHATGDWILYIDADERMRPYDRDRLREELNTPNLYSMTVRFFPQSGFTAYREHRLFRHVPALRFRGSMHETIRPDLDRIIRSGKGDCGTCDLIIDHLGYDGGRRRKADRDLPLLQKELQADPGRIYLWWHLGAAYRDIDRIAEAERAWLRGIETARGCGSDEPDIALCHIELVKLKLQRGEDVVALVDEAICLRPHNLLLHWLRARGLASAGRHAEAIAIFAWLGAIDPDTLLSDVSYDRRILGADALAEAGHCAFIIGDYDQSEAWYRRAALLAPGNLEFSVKQRFAAERARRGAAPRR